VADGLAEAEILEEIAGAGLGHGAPISSGVHPASFYSAFGSRHEAVRLR
jgi:hypothetical protein